MIIDILLGLLTYGAVLLASFIALAIAYVVLYKLIDMAHKTDTSKDDLIIKFLVGIPFLLLDWKVNWLLSPVFWEIPETRLELVTGRMKRYKRYKVEMITEGGTLFKWRHWFGLKLCKWLSKYDKDHC